MPSMTPVTRATVTFTATLTPSTTLYPSTNLYPRGNNVGMAPASPTSGAMTPA